MITVSVCVFMISGCRQPKPTQQNADPEEVSFVRLLSVPEKYDGKDVIVVGFNHPEFEGGGLYLTKEDARMGNTVNCFSVAGLQDGRVLTPNEVDCFVAVSGRFRAGPAGHMGLYPGQISPTYTISAFDLSTGRWTDVRPR